MIPTLFYRAVCNITRRKHALPVSHEHLHAFISASRAEKWHSFAIMHRTSRPQVCLPCAWLCDLLPREARIFEPACGSGANLLWLHMQGFKYLSGSDISPYAISLATMLARHMDAPLDVCVEDALHPRRSPSQVDAILSVNWLYHISGASLEAFFEVYIPSLARGGYIIFDMVCSTYNQARDNAWHTDDLGKMEHLRRQSEYRLRMSCEELTECAARFGCKVVRSHRLGTIPKRWIFAVQKR